jgi:coenzyme F420-reducing hydrogenase beta subunit
MLIEKEKCTGCGVCSNICPNSCIDMVSDSEGFLYPSTDLNNCINCGVCEKTCPVTNGIESENKPRPPAYAAWSLDKDIRFNSTSGGIFTELAKKIISDGGYVVGARYNDRHLVEHCIINDNEDISLLRQSKYVQSSSGNIYKEVKAFLKKDKTVMFVGTPCQCAGLVSFLGREHDNLLLCDFICRGVNSPKAYIKYLESMENEYDSLIKKVWFKNKINGWNKFCTKIEFENGKEYYADRHTDLFMVGFLKYNLYMRKSCSNCSFKGFPRNSDITLADFWGVKLQDETYDTDKGTSLVILSSDKGQKYFYNINNSIYKERSNLRKAISFNLCAVDSIYMGGMRQYFFEEIDKLDFSHIMNTIIEKRNM